MLHKMSSYVATSHASMCTVYGQMDSGSYIQYNTYRKAQIMRTLDRHFVKVLLLEFFHFISSPAQCMYFKNLCHAVLSQTKCSFVCSYASL